MPMPKHYSASMIQLWQRCPACFYLRYEKKDKTFSDSGPLFFGRAMSAALDDMHNQLNPDPLDSARNRFILEFEKQCELGMSPRPGVDHGIWLLEEYARKGIFQGVPEFRFLAEIKQLSIPILGYMDLLIEDDSGAYGIAEFKTSGQKWDQERVDSELQGILYWCSFWKLFKKLPDPFNYVIMRTDERRVDIFQAHYTKEQCLATLDILERVFSEMLLAHGDEGIFPGLCPVHKEKRVSKVPKPLPPRLIL